MTLGTVLFGVLLYAPHAPSGRCSKLLQTTIAAVLSYSPRSVRSRLQDMTECRLRFTKLVMHRFIRQVRDYRVRARIHLTKQVVLKRPEHRYAFRQRDVFSIIRQNMGATRWAA